HSQLKTGHPVRSAIHKQLNGRLVLRWVTTWESLLLYVLIFFYLSQSASIASSFLCLFICELQAGRDGSFYAIVLTWFSGTNSVSQFTSTCL
ncbi:hypothetical protein KCU64_g9374, partial [Aureobasidium melanogenum]